MYEIIAAPTEPATDEDPEEEKLSVTFEMRVFSVKLLFSSKYFVFY